MTRERADALSSFEAGDFALAVAPIPGLRSSFDLETHEVTARVNYRFSWGAPVGPRF
jgi:hypothetical protein